MIRLSAILATIALLTGCATIFSPGPTQFTATSDPSGATVEVTGVQNTESFTQTTPASFALSTGSDYNLTFELAGYESETITVRRTVDAWIVGSVLLGLLPVIVDVVTNNHMNHTMTVAHVDFTEQASTGEMHGIARLGLTDGDGNVEWVSIPLQFHKI